MSAGVKRQEVEGKEEENIYALVSEVRREAGMTGMRGNDGEREREWRRKEEGGER